MIKERREAVGLKESLTVEVVDHIKDLHKISIDPTVNLSNFCFALQEAAKKFNLTPAQVAMLAYDASEFITLRRIEREEFDAISADNLHYDDNFHD